MNCHQLSQLQMEAEDAEEALGRWLSWAQRSRIPEFIELRCKIKRHREAILSSIRYGLSNARIEAVNNKIKLTVRAGYGFRNIDNLITLIMLQCTSLPIFLPWVAIARGNQEARMLPNLPWMKSVGFVPVFISDTASLAETASNT
ncbi:MAG: transposase [Dehalococcoidia bacterium]|nr:transposase [Dehalococcoidia bacterium]